MKTNTLQIYFFTMLPLKVFIIRILTIILAKKFNNVAVLLHFDNQVIKYQARQMKIFHGGGYRRRLVRPKYQKKYS